MSTTCLCDADLRQSVENFRKAIGRDRVRLGAEVLGLIFVEQPAEHPHRFLLWQSNSYYGDGEWSWRRPAGEFVCTISGGTPNGKSKVTYDVFFTSSGGGIECVTFREYAREIAALLFGAYEHAVLFRESEFIRVLFEVTRKTNDLRWEMNEQPGHPATRRHLAWLSYVYRMADRYLGAVSAVISEDGTQIDRKWEDHDASPPKEHDIESIEPLMTARQIAIVVSHILGKGVTPKTLTDSSVLGPPTKPSKGGRGLENQWAYEEVRPKLKQKYGCELPELAEAWKILSLPR